MRICPVTATLLLEEKRWVPVSLRRWSLKPVRSAAFRPDLDFLEINEVNTCPDDHEATLFLAVFLPLVLLKNYKVRRSGKGWGKFWVKPRKMGWGGRRLKRVRRQNRSNYRLQGIQGCPWKGKKWPASADALGEPRRHLESISSFWEQI